MRQLHRQRTIIDGQFSTYTKSSENAPVHISPLSPPTPVSKQLNLKTVILWHCKTAQFSQPSEPYVQLQLIKQILYELC